MGESGQARRDALLLVLRARETSWVANLQEAVSMLARVPEGPLIGQWRVMLATARQALADTRGLLTDALTCDDDASVRRALGLLTEVRRGA